MRRIRTVLWAAVVALGLCVGNAAHAQFGYTSWEITATTAKTKSTKSSKKTKSAKSSVSFHNGSAESTPDRERRLRRECQGRSNSGLCEGFTR